MTAVSFLMKSKVVRVRKQTLNGDALILKAVIMQHVWSSKHNTACRVLDCLLSICMGLSKSRYVQQSGGFLVRIAEGREEET